MGASITLFRAEVNRLDSAAELLVFYVARFPVQRHGAPRVEATLGNLKDAAQHPPKRETRTFSTESLTRGAHSFGIANILDLKQMRSSF